MIKFGYDACWNWLKERALGEYRAWSLAEAVTPSAKIVLCPTFPGLLSSLFSIIESEISEQARRQVATEEPNRGL